MDIYTMGFTRKSARIFFGLIKQYKIEVVIDVRLNNQSQLAGFTKSKDLEFFLREICGCDYAHAIELAPTKEILDNYKKGIIDWSEYESEFRKLMKNRRVEEEFVAKFGGFRNVLLLCSEPTPEHCHRRLVAEYLSSNLDIKITYI